MAFSLFAALAWSKEDEVTPYRPSISNPAELPTPGRLELEFGGQHTKDSGTRDDSLPYLLKLAFTKEWGILLGGDAYVWSRDEQGVREHGFGDTTITLKRSFMLHDQTGFGLEFGAKAPTAKKAVGVGKPEYTLNGIYSQDFGRIHMDANLNTTRIGNVEPGTSRMQKGLSAAFSSEVSNSWSGTAEVSSIYRKGTPTDTQLLAAAVYSPNKRYAIDIGISKGLTKSSQDWSIFSGFVIPVGKLW
ncbi:hypothetical protein [Noviherbaspirillum sp. Root189]|uniref:hypothetical protein n=1 Tax=Noviherbaspirillum sp. Root189 TaxID=1736487 RepID=UPI00070F82A6|nr:hypothetical protein [Noviherbaspirillum sp. Root189]KRB71306.1 hypothetical protein ASE07_27220 [Noviherbaspirillum sp. Root189]